MKSKLEIKQKRAGWTSLVLLVGSILMFLGSTRPLVWGDYYKREYTSLKEAKSHLQGELDYQRKWGIEQFIEFQTAVWQTQVRYNGDQVAEVTNENPFHFRSQTEINPDIERTIDHLRESAKSFEKQLKDEGISENTRRFFYLLLAEGDYVVKKLGERKSLIRKSAVAESRWSKFAELAGNCLLVGACLMFLWWLEICWSIGLEKDQENRFGRPDVNLSAKSVRIGDNARAGKIAHPEGHSIGC